MKKLLVAVLCLLISSVATAEEIDPRTLYDDKMFLDQFLQLLRHLKSRGTIQLPIAFSYYFFRLDFLISSNSSL
jgi:hypothetical protein